MIKVFLVDDHQIVRDGIKSLLLKEEDIFVVAELSSYGELIEELKKQVPDLIILDISLQDKSGLDIAKELNSDYPDIRILILSMYVNEDYIMSAVKAGAMGYLPKNTSKLELLKAIRAIYNGENYYHSDISSIILKNLIKSGKTEIKRNEKVNLLSIREKEILKLYADGYSNKDIAEKFFISIRTVESHKNHIMQKLNLKSTVDMVKFAIKNNLIEI